MPLCAVALLCWRFGTRWPRLDRGEVWPLMRQVTQDMGQTAGPEEAYLALRGLRTMGMRLERSSASALTM